MMMVIKRRSDLNQNKDKQTPIVMQRRRSSRGSILSTFFYYPLGELIDDPNRMWSPEYDLKAGRISVFLTELCVQMEIQWQDLTQTPFIIGLYLLYYITVALVIAFSTYPGPNEPSIRMLNTQLGVLVNSRIVITIVTFPLFASAFEVDRVRYIHGEDRRIPSNDDDRGREYPQSAHPPQAGGILFSTGSVYLAKLIVNSLVFSLLFIPFTAIVYPIVGLRGGFNYVLVFLLALILQQIAAISLGLAISAACRHRLMAQTVASSAVVILILLSGSLYNISTVTWILRWLQFIIFSFYTNQALIHNQFQGQAYPFFPFTGEAFMNIRGDNVLGTWAAIGGDLGLILIINVVGLCIFHWQEKRYRKQRSSQTN